MKFRFLVLLLLCLLLTGIAFAQHDFGVYWRTRAYSMKNFSGDTTPSQENSIVDTRTRIYYTAKVNKNLKLVNAFEMDAQWGDSSSYGDVGTDAITLEIKHSYADMEWESGHLKIGAQGGTVARGFLLDDDFAGINYTYKLSDNVTIPIIWAKAYTGGAATHYDVDYYAINPTFKLSDSFSFNPYLFVYRTPDGGAFTQTANYDSFTMYYAGLNVDATFGDTGFKFTGIYQTGEGNLSAGSKDDYSGYLLYLGVDQKFGSTGVHFNSYYASGDNNTADNDQKAFLNPTGASHYWAEIMGYGYFDNQVSAGSAGDKMTNLLALNIGASVPLGKGKTLSFDVWNASLVENDANGQDSLGTEFDLVYTQSIFESAQIDIVAAYLLAGDAVSSDGSNADKNPIEFGTQLSFSF